MNVACEIFFSIYFFLKKNICLKGSFHSYKLIAMKEDNLQYMMIQSNGSCDIVLTDINMESASLILNCNFIWIFCWPAFIWLSLLSFESECTNVWGWKFDWHHTTKVIFRPSKESSNQCMFLIILVNAIQGCDFEVVKLLKFHLYIRNC